MITNDFEIGDDCAELTCYTQSIAASFDAQHFSGGAVVKLYIDYISDASGTEYHYADFDCDFNASTGALNGSIEIGDHNGAFSLPMPPQGTGNPRVLNQRVLSATHAVNLSLCLSCDSNVLLAQMCFDQPVTWVVTPFGGRQQGYVI